MPTLISDAPVAPIDRETVGLVVTSAELLILTKN